MKKLHLEILDLERKKVFETLAAFGGLGYLAGGTALALQLGHRISYDFDIFCEKEIADSLPAKIKKEISIREVIVSNQDEFTFLTENSIKVSFVFYPFDLKKYLIEFLDLPLMILSPLGVAASKAYALNRRNAWRDYVDLYFILKRGFATLEDILQETHNIFGNIFNEKLFLAQLVYTEDIAQVEIAGTQLLEDVSLDEIKYFFEKEVDAHLAKRI